MAKKITRLDQIELTGEQGSDLEAMLRTKLKGGNHRGNGEMVTGFLAEHETLLPYMQYVLDHFRAGQPNDQVANILNILNNQFGEKDPVWNAFRNILAEIALPDDPSKLSPEKGDSNGSRPQRRGAGSTRSRRGLGD